MSELKERRWAVISERGCEARDLVYDEAARLMRERSREKIRGLCVVTREAASHLAPVEPPSGDENPAEAAPTPAHAR
ncbi:MAG: hypothetical protein ACRD68_04105, partial [Pyrinomonadaceae bacterium]